MTDQPGSSIAAGADFVVVPCEKRVRAVVAGDVTIVDTLAALILLQRGRRPVYYFPLADVRTDLLTPGSRRSENAAIGAARYWTLTVAGKCTENAAFDYAAPHPAAAALARHFAFEGSGIDHWYEEDEEVFGHPRDPYHRIDVRPSRRQVRVTFAGVEIAATRSGIFLFETGLPVRYYIPPGDVRRDLLERSSSRTVCPYKGFASYWSLRAGGTEVPDAAWSYEEPLPECPRIKGHLCFYPDRVAIAVEGVGERQ